MRELGDVLFKVNAGQPDVLVRHLLAGKTFAVNVDAAGKTERHVVLGELIVFRHVRIEVALAVEFAAVRNAAFRHEPRHDSLADRLAVRSRQHAGMSHADRADVCIRFGPETVRAFAEHLGIRFYLNVHFQADNSFISSHNYVDLLIF